MIFFVSFCKKILKRGCSGFSLIEMSFVLVVMGTLFGSAVSLVRGYLEMNKQALTAQNQEKVIAALAAFLGRTGRLPLPDFYEEDPCGMEHSGNDSPYPVGRVPFSTLGISEATAKDGRGNFMTYAVDRFLTAPAAPIKKIFCFSFFAQPPQIDVVFKGFSNNAILKKTNLPNRKDAVAFVLISHFKPRNLISEKRQSFQSRGTLGCAELNQISNNLFCEQPHKDEHGPFKDRVAWMSRTAILSLSGIVCTDLLFNYSAEEEPHAAISQPSSFHKTTTAENTAENFHFKKKSNCEKTDEELYERKESHSAAWHFNQMLGEENKAYFIKKKPVFSNSPETETPNSLSNTPPDQLPKSKVSPEVFEEIEKADRNTLSFQNYNPYKKAETQRALTSKSRIEQLRQRIDEDMQKFSLFNSDD